MFTLFFCLADFGIAYSLILSLRDEIWRCTVLVCTALEMFPVLKHSLNEHRSQTHKFRDKPPGSYRAVEG
jgi:hypothetical protein